MPEAPGAEGVEQLEELELEEIEAEAGGDGAEAAAATDGAEADGQPEEVQFEPIFTGAHGVGTRFAGRIGRHATAYGAAAVAGIVSGLVSVAVFTRFLDPGEFGKMAVLSTIATVVTMLGTLGIMQGTMRRVYGTAGDDEGGDIDVAEGGRVAADPRLALSTGLALSCLFCGGLFLLGIALRGPLGDLFGADDSALFVLALGAGAAGGVMRFAQNILRLQLRSGAYLVVNVVYAFAGIPVAIVLLEAGLGIEAVLIGFIVANTLSAAICLLLLAGDLRPAVSLHEAGQILRGGLVYLPLMLSFHVVQMGDTLLVAGFGSFSQTGVYRVAQRIAMPISFGTSVFQQAWGPLKRDMTHVAVDRVDEARAYTAHLFTYYAVFVAALILPIAVLADQLVRLASGAFGEAATIVPLTALSVAGHGWFIFAYRNARLPKQMLWMIVLSLLGAVLFIGFSVLLIPSLGAVGAPLAAIAAWGLVTFVMLVANELVGESIPYEWRNMLLLGALTLCAWLLARWVLPETSAGTAAKLALLVAWVAALLATRVVPMAEVRAVGRFLRDASGVDSRRELRARLGALGGLDGQLVEDLVRRRLPPAQVAEQTGLSEDEVLARTVHALRTAAGGGKETERDAKLGFLIFTPRPRAERDMALMMMAHKGADPLDADLIMRAAGAASGVRRSTALLGRRGRGASPLEQPR